MKHLFKRIIPLTYAIVLGLTLTSCKDSDEQDETDSVEMFAVYDMELNQTWLDFFDIHVTYFDKAGTPCETTVKDKWHFGFDTPSKKAPHHYYCKIIATPKANLPEFDRQEYVFENKVECSVFCLNYSSSLANYPEVHPDLMHTISTANDTVIYKAADLKRMIEYPDLKIWLMDFRKSWDGKLTSPLIDIYYY